MIYRVETGIWRFYNRYRASAHLNRKQVQEYFDTVEECRRWRAEIKRQNTRNNRGGYRPYTNNGKRKDAKHKDLPVGLIDLERIRPLRGGGFNTHHVIRAQITAHGELLWSCGRSYSPTLRTREEAIEIVERERRKMEKFLFGKEGSGNG